MTDSLQSDPFSYSTPSIFTTSHISIDWTIDFVHLCIFGSCTLDLKRLAPADHPHTGLLILDCTLLSVSQVLNAVDGDKLEFIQQEQEIRPGLPGQGRLLIDVSSLGKSQYLKIKIDYSTALKSNSERSIVIPDKWATLIRRIGGDNLNESSLHPASSAIQWLQPEQTVGKQFPYLFTQCQAIHARTIIPCQDTPSVKATYSAHVRVPDSLNVVMSANRRSEVGTELSDDGSAFRVVFFEQTQPISSYLLAIAAGNLTSRRIGPRSSVWSEPEILDQAAYEFAETETFLKTAEELTFEYQWETYDILLLPSSFPYGGMENPCLTFLTPSLLSGDRSLVDVVTHEIAHSWTGNLVTNSDWQHFWLNEGFTMFFERKILGRLYGQAFRHFHAILGLGELHEAVDFFGSSSNMTRLVPDPTFNDPDEAFSVVPYEKGHTFLFFLEQLIGDEENFEQYFAAHIRQFAGISLGTEDWKAFLLDYFKDKHLIYERLKEVDWIAWLKGTGMPPCLPEYDQSLVEPCQHLARCWNTYPDGLKEDIKDLFLSKFIPLQRVYFLDYLAQISQHKLDHQILSCMDNQYELTKSKNVEIAYRWFRLCLRSRYEAVYAAAAEFATLHGRMKYCRPIYRELFKCFPFGTKLALETFSRHRSFYHPIAANLIAKDLELE